MAQAEALNVLPVEAIEHFRRKGLLPSYDWRDVDAATHFAIIAPNFSRAFTVSEPPAVEMREWVNGRTGEIRQVPKGVSPGFDHNVGLVDPVRAAKQLQTKKASRADWPELTKAIEKPKLDDYIIEGREIRRDLLGPQAMHDLTDARIDKLQVHVLRGLEQRRGAGAGSKCMCSLFHCPNRNHH